MRTISGVHARAAIRTKLARVSLGPRRNNVFLGGGALLLVICGSAMAERLPVLPQIEVPHDYYYREMYLPQLTTGPASLAWTPDGSSLVYSMQGSLWLQATDSTVARQLTAGPDYDYQPDVSPDGKRVVFARYDGKAIELCILDLTTGKVSVLTSGGDVNVEPRWSPDGRRIAFVSTRGSGRFHVFIGALTDGGFDSRPLVEERESRVPRYYYSEYDHELSPSWTPDGRGLVLVANPETPYGTGEIWLLEVDDGAKPLMIRQEETSWKARPDVSPDGRRVVYASYLGRQWHQLWVTTIGGNAEPFPLTYGDFDATSPRWSPDAMRIAYIANDKGNTEIRIRDVVGGLTRVVATDIRQFITAVAELELKVVDSKSRPLAARVSIVASDGRGYAPGASWMHADDSFDRNISRTEPHYFHIQHSATLTLPAGPANVTVWRGLEYGTEERTIDIVADRTNRLTVRLRRLDLPQRWQDWVSADVHVHMNYGGAYRNTPERLIGQAAAEDLDVVFNLIVNKEQRIPDIAYFTPHPDAASTDDVLLVHAQEFHTSYWGHQGLLGLRSNLLIPGYAAYPGTAAASLYPDNATVAELAREQGATVGYVHPFYAAPDPANDRKLTHALPVDAALGLVDYYEVVGFADHRASADVWYRLMNCGLRIAAGGGTDAMANFASLRGPAGVNRTYVRVAGDAKNPAQRRDEWLNALASGHSIATNGPLLGFDVERRGPGEEISLVAGRHELAYRGFMRSTVPVDHVEVVHNGRVIDTIDVSENRRSVDFSGQAVVDGPGWLLLRAWNDASHPLIFDRYPYATTTPVWISVDGQGPRSKSDAEYFIAWIERLRQAAADHPDYNNEAEISKILPRLDAAAARFQACN
jgi:TolB protein